jgi:hypothetical protein
VNARAIAGARNRLHDGGGGVGVGAGVGGAADDGDHVAGHGDDVDNLRVDLRPAD